MMENTETKTWTPPTGIALEVQQWLHKRAKSVLGKSGNVTPRSIRAVANRCCAISLCKQFEHVDPKEVALAMRSLIDKEVVREFTLDGLPCFIPVSYCTIAVMTFRKLEQGDIDNG